MCLASSGCGGSICPHTSLEALARTMDSSLPILLSFGLCLSLRITAHQVTLPRPVLWAKPSSMVAWGADVILWCQGVPEVDMYRLERLGTSDDYRDQPGLPGPRPQARFSLGSASATVAGKYRCSYRNGSYWSKPSSQLELVVTGVYGKPSFSVQPGPEVLWGKSVTFSCESQFSFNMFAVAKEGRAGIWRTQEGKSPARFPILTVAADHAGTYLCYAFDSHFPYLWTAPSDPLELKVTGVPRTQSPTEGATPTGAPTHPHISPEKVDIPMGVTSQDYTVPNLVRLVLAGLVVAALGGLVAEAWQAWREEFHPYSGALFQRGSPGSPPAARGSTP
ncbi:platelet glycoprotein VI-like isoform X2 [Monodelphis domestica]|uniref:platelet glycoprotein VI-like isoform X2 n=1 Tax=Monodelphis domestica TaxID=13616 RepID=UPI0024E1F9F7|nr:platelet glycoprotein VI-like isoform X2 [Monodelphis domestica]